MNRPSSLARLSLAVGLLTLTGLSAKGEPRTGPFKVTITDGQVVATEAPPDPTPHIAIGQGTGAYFGLTVDGKRITCTPQQSIWSALRLDEQFIFQPDMNGLRANKPAVNNLPPGPFGKKRLGYQSEAQFNKIHITQVVEIIPSKVDVKAAPSRKRQLDTCRISYLIHNQDSVPHKVDYRASIDIMINNNDGAIYASPTTHPGLLLDGVILEGKKMPHYVQVLENPNLVSPGMVATLSFKSAKAINPNRVVLSNLGAVLGGQQTWDVAAVPAMGDSACAIYWNGHPLGPGAKCEFVWGYGAGLASDPENEGKVQLDLGGSFEPNKLFTITATVEDPAPNQVLTIDLPSGLELAEGRAIQPVPLPGPEGSSLVLWKGRVRRIGAYTIKVHSTTGMIQAKHVRIESKDLSVR